MINMCIGNQDFKTIVEQENSPYVDKTHFIEQVLRENMVLYTRPRRFGKTLNMSMLYYFFSNKEDSKELFNNLKISKNDKAMKHLNQYPVIYLSFGGSEFKTLDKQLSDIGSRVMDIVLEYPELMTSEYLTDYQKESLKRLETKEYNDNDLEESLNFISRCLYLHYNEKVIILIDEYDVPLNYSRGKYYEELYNFYSVFLSKGLKYNKYIKKGILTGCLNIAKNSSYTGLNNIRVRSVLDYRSSDCFGFTQDELDNLLEKCSLLEKRHLFKDWYDGYQFGETEIYNPWSVCAYIDELQDNIGAYPDNYWINTGRNNEIYDYIKEGDKSLKDEFKRLIDGESISKRIYPYLNHRDLDEYSNSSIYSFLLFSGYLKIISPTYDEYGESIRNTYNLMIPNKEVREIYVDSFTKWFNATYKNYDIKFIEALLKKDVKEANDILNASLFQTVSYYDNNESFYHGYMTKLLDIEDYIVESNMESGLGKYDLFIHTHSLSTPSLLIECKHSKSRENLKIDAYNGIKQIKERQYIEGLTSKEYKNVIAYCISFYKKECYISIL